jgi:hypothetical protein
MTIRRSSHSSWLLYTWIGTEGPRVFNRTPNKKTFFQKMFPFYFSIPTTFSSSSSNLLKGSHLNANLFLIDTKEKLW